MFQSSLTFVGIQKHLAPNKDKISMSVIQSIFFIHAKTHNEQNSPIGINPEVAEMIELVGKDTKPVK